MCICAHVPACLEILSVLLIFPVKVNPNHNVTKHLLYLVIDTQSTSAGRVIEHDARK